MSTICLFLPTGRTFTFRQATIVIDNENALVLDYTAMSDGRVATINVQKSAIVGYSVKEDEGE